MLLTPLTDSWYLMSLVHTCSSPTTQGISSVFPFRSSRACHTHTTLLSLIFYRDDLAGHKGAYGMVHAVVICLRVCAVCDCMCARTFCSLALSGLPSLNPRMGSFFTSTAAQGKVLKLHTSRHTC
jgi:hypothetical protein